MDLSTLAPKHRSPVRTLLLVLVLFAVPMLACEFSASTATVSNAVMAKDVKGDTFEPSGITDSFSSDQGKFHAVVTISNAPSDTAVKAVWTAVDLGGVAPPSTLISETELKSSGTRNLDFSLAPSGPAWPPGSYKVDIYLNGKLNRTLNFTVAAAQAVASPQPSATVLPTTRPSATQLPTTRPLATLPPLTIGAPTLPPATKSSGNVCPPLTLDQPRPSGIVTKVTMARGTTGDNKDPANPTNVFAPNATFHAVVTIKGAPTDTNVAVDWYANDLGGTHCNEEIDSADIDTDGSRNIDFILPPPSSGWPIGTYRAEISVDYELDSIVTFGVSGTAPTSPATKATAQPTTRATSTRAPATATRAPTPRPTTAPTTAPVTLCGAIPAGMGSVVFISKYGQEILIDIGPKLYKIPPMGKSDPVYLAPGTHDYHAKINQFGDANGKLTIELGKCLEFTWAP